jgi:hypothetical protein
VQDGLAIALGCYETYFYSLRPGGAAGMTLVT